MSTVNERPADIASFKGYYRNLTATPDQYLQQVERGTPGGDFHRRFWQPVAYVRELGKVPLRVRALGEDLVVFKNLKGEVGCLHLHCCHRNSSLEFGILTDDGIRCCYHGREYALNGTCIAMPGDPNAERIMKQVNQGGYPTHIFNEIVFIYMGPPEDVPVFPVFDRFGLPGVRDLPGYRLTVDCNWLQIKENAMDAHHTAVLHVIPHMRGSTDPFHFAGEFGVPPVITWVEAPHGCIYFGARTVADMLWVRSAEIMYPNLHIINAVTESGRNQKYSSAPFLSMWTLPIDSEHSVQFVTTHYVDAEGEGGIKGMNYAERQIAEVFGQIHNDRPYEERQWIPGDVDAQESQGAINPHDLETLGTLDRGITMFRKMVRQGIDAVAKGETPAGFYRSQDDVPPTFANDYIVPASEAGIDTDDPNALRAFSVDVVWKKYQERPPMRDYREKYG